CHALHSVCAGRAPGTAHGEHLLPLGWGHSVSPDREKAGDLRVSQQTQDSDSAEFGPNQWLVDALREQWREDPSSVDPSWAEYFSTQGPATADGSPAETSPEPASTTTSTGAPARSSDGSSQDAASATADPGGATPAAQPSKDSSAVNADTSKTSTDSAASTQPAVSTTSDRPEKVPTTTAQIPAVELREPEVVKLRGPAAAVARNMDESLGVPTATS